MKKRVIFVIVIVAILILLGVYFGVDKNEKNNVINYSKSADYCLSDSECVPSQCCHASSCTSATNIPVCNGVMCTMECKPGTLDCGQAKCACVNNKCDIVKR